MYGIPDERSRTGEVHMGKGVLNSPTVGFCTLLGGLLGGLMGGVGAIPGLILGFLIGVGIARDEK